MCQHEFQLQYKEVNKNAKNMALDMPGMTITHITYGGIEVPVTETER